MAKVDIRDVRKSFGGNKPVLEGINVAVADGEFVSLLGPSGCGKSTLLRIIAGLEYADSGRISIGGRDVSRVAPKDRDIAMVFQNYALYPHLLVAENIGMGLKLRKYPKDDIERRVAESAKMLGLEELLGRKPAALSGGQRQRVALARSLVRRPQVYLLDEPLSNLDAVLREKTRGELKLLFRRVKGTAIYVTHDQIEAMTLSDRIVVLHGGRIQQIGTPDEIYHKPANTFVAAFLGSPPMNVFPLKDAAGAVDAGKHDPETTLAGIRPEDVKVSDKQGSGFQAGKVVLAEPTGAQTVLAVESGEFSFRAVWPGNWKTGSEEAWFRMPADRMHYFRSSDGERIS